MPQGVYPAADVCALGDEISSTYEGRHVTLLESLMTHPTHTDGFVNKGDPIIVGDLVGVAFKSAAAATDYIAVDTEGIWNLLVVGTDDAGNSAVAIGDTVYISTAGVLSKAESGKVFGTALGAVVSAATTTVIAVKVHNERDLRRIYVNETLQGAAAATAANYGKIFVATQRCKVVMVSEVHTTAAGQTATLDVERLQGTEASGAGDVLLAATKIDFEGTAETVQSPDLTATAAHLILEIGDRLNLVDAGTLTTLAGVCVTVELVETV